MAFDYHAQNNNAASATALTEAHNNYVQQLHAANGMVDQYYKETLPQLLQELDDVYHDVSAVVAETLVQGADVMALKSAEMSRRYEKASNSPKQINPPQDLNAFVKTLNIPDALTVSRHVFAPPQPTDPAQVSFDFDAAHVAQWAGNIGDFWLIIKSRFWTNFGAKNAQ